jgi:hypothetical protein
MGAASLPHLRPGDRMRMTVIAELTRQFPPIARPIFDFACLVLSSRKEVNMMLSFRGPYGSSISLDLAAKFGPSVELEYFQFVTPPMEFRLVRDGHPLQEWQAGNTEMYDLQHGPGVKEWERDERWFRSDLVHRRDVMTCGVLSKSLVMETRCLAGDFLLMVWIREGTARGRSE